MLFFSPVGFSNHHFSYYKLPLPVTVLLYNSIRSAWTTERVPDLESERPTEQQNLIGSPTIRDIHIVVQYSDHNMNTGLVLKWHSNKGPFGDPTIFDHLNNRLVVWYSDPHCITHFEPVSIWLS